MSLDALREFALEVQAEVTGLLVTVTRWTSDSGFAAPVTTFAQWLSPLEEGRPIGVDFARSGARKVLAIQKTADIPALPKGSTVIAAELDGGPLLNWRVDGYESAIEPDLIRVVLLPLPTKDTL